MRKLLLYLSLILTLISCAKENELPSEFDQVIGKWKAYKYRHIFNFGEPFASYTDYSTDSLGLEYYIVVNQKKIEISNSLTNSSVFSIKNIEILLKDTAQISFGLETYSYLNTEKKSHYITYYYCDEIHLSSASEVFNNSYSDVDMYFLKRVED